MIDTDLLLIDTKKQVVALIDDLRTVAVVEPAAQAHIISGRGAGPPPGLLLTRPRSS